MESIQTDTLAGRSRKERLVRAALTLLVMAAPAVIAIVLTALRGQNLFRSLPVWSDEQLWTAQYGAMSRYGRPLGYFGYAGTHARLGHYGPWGMYPTLLIGLLARIGGWGLHAFVYYNIFLLAAAALIFILLTNPTNRALVRLAAANATAYLAICYIPICMNECARYAMGLVLSGLMYRLVTVPEVSRVRKILRCTLVPLLLLFATAFYTILGAFIPVYLILMLRRLKPAWRAVITAPVSYVVIQFLRTVNNRTACPYVIGNSVSFTPPTLRLKLMTFYYSVLGNANQVDPYNLLTSTESITAAPMLLWFCVLLYVLMGVLIWRLIVTWKFPEKRAAFSVQAIGLFLLLCFWGGHILLYNTTSWTFIRGCYTAVYCAVMLCALLPEDETHAWRTGFIIALTGFFTFVTAFSNTFTPTSHFSTAEQDAAFAARRAAIADVIALDRNAEDPWANTIALVGEEKDGEEDYYVLPYGAGLNLAAKGVLNENARYVIVGDNYDDPAQRDADLQTLRESGHVVLYEDDGCTILENTAGASG